MGPDPQRQCCGCEGKNGPCDSCGCIFNPQQYFVTKIPGVDGSCYVGNFVGSEYPTTKCDMCNELISFVPSTGGTLDFFSGTPQNRNFSDTYTENVLAPLEVSIWDGNSQNVWVGVSPIPLSPPIALPIDYSLDFNYSIFSSTGFFNLTGVLQQEIFFDAPDTFNIYNAPSLISVQGKFSSGEKLFIACDVASPKICGAFFSTGGTTRIPQIYEICSDTLDASILMGFSIPGSTFDGKAYLNVNGADISVASASFINHFSTGTIVTGTTIIGNPAADSYCSTNYTFLGGGEICGFTGFDVGIYGCGVTANPVFWPPTGCARNSSPTFYTPSYEILTGGFEITILRDQCIRFSIETVNTPDYPIDFGSTFRQVGINVNVKLVDRFDNPINPLSRFQSFLLDTSTGIFGNILCNQLP